MGTENNGSQVYKSARFSSFKSVVGGRVGVVVLSSPFTSDVPGSIPGRVCGLGLQSLLGRVGFPPGDFSGGFPPTTKTATSSSSSQVDNKSKVDAKTV